MSSNNLGKVFEKNVKENAQKQGLWIYRIMDSDLSFCNGNSKFTQKNIGDFLIFDCENRVLYLAECKSTKYKSISFDRTLDDKKMIKLHQIKSLTDNNNFENVESIFVFNFREEDDLNNIIDEDTYIMSIKDFNDFYCETDKNSINKLDIINYNGIKINQEKKRKYFSYEIKKALEEYFIRKQGG